MELVFEWDPVKASSNLEKHGVTFEMAAEVFRDPLALTIYDEDHSVGDEDRWLTLGQVLGNKYVIVAHTYRNQKTNQVTIRIISARQATRNEINQYEQGE